jgi:hypothetical protein
MKTHNQLLNEACCEFCGSSLKTSNAYRLYGNNRYWHWLCAIWLDYGDNPNKWALITKHFNRHKIR